jgi:hypothetical protein
MLIATLLFVIALYQSEKLLEEKVEIMLFVARFTTVCKRLRRKSSFKN